MRNAKRYLPILLAALLAAGVWLGFALTTGAGEKNDSQRASARRNERILKHLAVYEAPITVWKKTVLLPGQEESEVFPQRPITKPDGSVETNKSIIVDRGDFADGEFDLDSAGDYFQITLLVNGAAKAAGVGLLRPGEGFGCSMWCRDAKDPTIGEFNCYFKTTLEADGSVSVLWTMWHPGTEHESAH